MLGNKNFYDDFVHSICHIFWSGEKMYDDKVIWYWRIRLKKPSISERKHSSFSSTNFFFLSIVANFNSRKRNLLYKQQNFACYNIEGLRESQHTKKHKRSPFLILLNPIRRPYTRISVCVLHITFAIATHFLWKIWTPVQKVNVLKCVWLILSGNLPQLTFTNCTKMSSDWLDEIFF